MSRTFLVDDMDPGIQYTGLWAQAFGTRNDFGNFGPPYNATLHGISAHGSLSFQFTGDSVRALAAIDGYETTSLNSVWSCFLDGVQIPNRYSPVSSINNWIICENNMTLGSHNFSVTVTAQNKYDFWFDQIQYTQPSSSTDSLNGRTLEVQDSDPSIQYGSDWLPLVDIARMTQTTGASMKLQFNGTSLTWYGLYPDSYPRNASSATYSIDGQSPTPFFLQGLADDDISQYNQVFFKTPQLSPGQHTLQVIHQGNSQTTPLNLDYLAIEGVESKSGTSTSSPISPASNTAPAANTAPAGGNSTGKHSPTGAIVGGVVGGLAVVLLFVLALVYMRRQKQGREPAASSANRGNLMDGSER